MRKIYFHFLKKGFDRRGCVRQDAIMDEIHDEQRPWRLAFNEWCGADRSLAEIELDLLGHGIKLSQGQISALRNPEFKRTVSKGVAKRLAPVIKVHWRVAYP